jgi:hypothetical protein
MPSMFDNDTLQAADDLSCAQCLREYSLFNRRSECKFCGENVCGNCFTQLAEVPPSKELSKVCDCCWGILTGMVSL